ncbi:MAG: alpha/beta fold hydrolase, partial [Acidobacteriota bacterium]|nr:alpha/beta fold hydrolase [Acidobacteriota bacterium]
MPEPTYLLVHGAWHGAWCWRDVAAELDRRRVPWRAVDLPSSRDPEGVRDLRDDAAAVVALADVGGPVVLVGHSYGGAVIAEAASRVPELAGLVYLAALVPRPGQSATDASREVRVRTALDDATVVDGPLLRVRADGAAAAFYGDCSLADQGWAVAQLSSQTLASFRCPRQEDDPPTPRRYVLCERDRAIDPSLQDVMSARCDEVVRLASDHSPFLSHPRECVTA